MMMVILVIDAEQRLNNPFKLPKAGSHYQCPDPQNIVKHMKNGSGDKIGDYDCGHTETNKSTPESGALQNWASNGGCSANCLKILKKS